MIPLKRDPGGNDILVENLERLTKHFPEDITFLKEQLKNHSLLHKLVKRENIVVECNHVSSHETSDTETDLDGASKMERFVIIVNGYGALCDNS